MIDDDAETGPDLTVNSAEEEPRPRTGSARTVGVVIFAAFLGLLAGIGTFTFGYGQGASYLSNDPQSCANCHVMQDHIDTWQHSSHHHVAVCNDCHLPHDFAGKWLTKADNGLFHSIAFTLQNYHDPIQIKPRNRRVTQSACVACHGDFVHQLGSIAASPGHTGAAAHDMPLCVHCHADVGHAFRTFSTGVERE